MPRTDSFGQTITELWMQKIITEKQADAVVAERARIATEVRGLEGATLRDHDVEIMHYPGLVSRAAVLAIIEGTP